MTEEDLIKGCVKEDRECQKELYLRFSGKMMAVCLRYAGNRMEAEDMLQEGFIKVFDNIGKFKREGSLEGWIRARRRSIDHSGRVVRCLRVRVLVCREPCRSVLLHSSVTGPV